MHIAIRDEKSKKFCYKESDNLLLKMGPEVSIAVKLLWKYNTLAIIPASIVYS